MNRLFSKLATFSLYGAITALLLASPLAASAAAFSPQEVLNLANADRMALGLPALRLDAVLSKTAEAKANDMVKRDYFAHTSPDGTTPWYFFEKEGYQYRFAGENLAIHFTDAKSEEFAWMASEKHRENILSSKYRDTGIAVAEMPWEGKTTVLTVQVFGTRLGESIPDLSVWKSLSSGVPTVSAATVSDADQNTSAKALSSAPTDVTKNTAVPMETSPSFFSLVFSGSVLRALAFIFLALIGILEIVAAGIMYRIFVRHASFERSITPM